jgi:PIN domain nuclease of toxin-antitoxin system
MTNSLLVLDSSAYLALVHLETGHEEVARRLLDTKCVMSAVNIAEVLSKQAEIGIPAAEAMALLQLTGVGIELFGPADAELTASLRQSTRTHGLSLGDRACLALGLCFQCPVLTADLLWSKVDIGIEVIQIR